MMKKFSIIIPVYNSEKYIENCLNSIIQQDYDNYEIILINDNSQDSTGFKLEQIRKRHPNICIKYFYNEKNIGAGASRNVGIDHAEGEYLLFVDSDDYLVNKNALCEIDQKLKSDTNPDILIFGSVMNYKKSDDSSALKMQLIPKKKEENKKYQLTKKILRFVWPMCIKNDLIKKNGIRFQEDLDIYEDVIFRTQAIAHSRKIKTYSKVCYNYNRRLNMKSLSSNADIKINDKLSDLVKAVKRINELAENDGVPSDQIKDFKKTALLFFPGVVVITANHLLSKVTTKFQQRNKSEQKQFDER